MSKTITIDPDGVITASEALTDQEKIQLGEFLFEQAVVDQNTDEFLFYTGIQKTAEEVSEGSCYDDEARDPNYYNRQR